MSLKPNSRRYGTTPSLFCQGEANAVVLTITCLSDSSEYVSGFLHLWVKYVRGFNQRFHCQQALRGPLSKLVKTNCTPINTRFSLSETHEYDCLYLCGVARGPVADRRQNNLHLPLKHCVGARFVHATYNGYLLHVENAVILPTPELPKGWNGLPDTYTRCRNFRFCVHRFGYSPESIDRDAIHHSWQADSIRERCEAGFIREPLDAPLDRHASEDCDSA